MSNKKKPYNLSDGKKGAALAIRVTSRATKNEITEILNDGTVKVRLTAAPVNGEDNKMLIEFLSSVLEISPSRLDIVAGGTGHDKLVSVLDMNAQMVQKKILKSLS